jgi:putative ABC transport system permease protein
MDYQWMRDLRLDVGLAVRCLRRAPAFAALVILILALGIGANSAIFSVVNGVLLRELPYDHPERIAYLWQRWDRADLPRVNASVPEFRDYEAGASTLEAIGGVVTAGTTLGDTLQPERIEMALVTPGFFDVFGVHPALGRAFTPEEALVPFAVFGLLSDRLWRNKFAADPGVIGSVALIGGRRITILGVMPPRFDFPRGVDVWRPLVLTGNQSDRSRRFIDVLVRIKPGVSLSVAEQDVHATEQRVPEHAVAVTQLVSLRDELVGPVQDALVLLMSVVGLVLLLACVNVANLLLARATRRQREVAVRVALGASRGRLVRQMLTESLVLSLAGAVLGLALAQAAMASLRVFGAGRIPRLEEISLDARVLGFTLVVSLLTGLLFGLVPAVSAARGEVATVFRGGRGSAGRGTQRLRSGLIVAELALSLMLAVGASLLARSFSRLRSVDLGFQEDRLLTFSVGLPFALYPEPGRRTRFFEELLGRIRAMPDVVSAGATSILPVSIPNASSSAIAEGQERDGGFPEADVRTVTPGYLEALQVPLLRGRMLDPRDGADSGRKVALVNRRLAERLWAGVDPLGKRFSVNAPPDRPDWREVVGVVGDMRHGPLEAPARIAMYEPHTQAADGTLSLVVRTRGDPLQLGPRVREAVRGLDPTIPVYQVRSMAQHLGDSLGARRFHVFLIGAFSGLAVALAGVGLYGVISYAVAQRNGEIGVRMALGAEQSQVARMVIGQGLRLALIGIAVGTAGALAASRAIAGLLYGVTPADPTSFIATAMLLVLVAVAASWIPARRAARIDPLSALRDE